MRDPVGVPWSLKPVVRLLEGHEMPEGRWEEMPAVTCVSAEFDKTENGV